MKTRNLTAILLALLLLFVTAFASACAVEEAVEEPAESIEEYILEVPVEEEPIVEEPAEELTEEEPAEEEPIEEEPAEEDPIEGDFVHEVTEEEAAQELAEEEPLLMLAAAAAAEEPQEEEDHEYVDPPEGYTTDENDNMAYGIGNWCEYGEVYVDAKGNVVTDTFLLEYTTGEYERVLGSLFTVEELKTLYSESFTGNWSNVPDVSECTSADEILTTMKNYADNVTWSGYTQYYFYSAFLQTAEQEGLIASNGETVDYVYALDVVGYNEEYGWLQSTFGYEGFPVILRLEDDEENPFVGFVVNMNSGEDAIVVNDLWYWEERPTSTVAEGIKVNVSANIRGEAGNIVQMVVEVVNESRNAFHYSLGIGADVQIADNDKASVTLNTDEETGKVTGLTMTDNSDTGASLVAVTGDNAAVTDVDTLHVSYYWDEDHYPYAGNTGTMFEEGMGYDESYYEGCDSAISFGWVNRTLAARSSATYSFLLGIGNLEDIEEAAEEAAEEAEKEKRSSTKSKAQKEAEAIAKKEKAVEEVLSDGDGETQATVTLVDKTTVVAETSSETVAITSMDKILEQGVETVTIVTPDEGEVTLDPSVLKEKGYDEVTVIYVNGELVVTSGDEDITQEVQDALTVVAPYFFVLDASNNGISCYPNEEMEAAQKQESFFRVVETNTMLSAGYKYLTLETINGVILKVDAEMMKELGYISFDITYKDGVLLVTADGVDITDIAAAAITIL